MRPSAKAVPHVAVTSRAADANSSSDCSHRSRMPQVSPVCSVKVRQAGYRWQTLTAIQAPLRRTATALCVHACPLLCAHLGRRRMQARDSDSEAVVVHVALVAANVLLLRYGSQSSELLVSYCVLSTTFPHPVPLDKT